MSDTVKFAMLGFHDSSAIGDCPVPDTGVSCYTVTTISVNTAGAMCKIVASTAVAMCKIVASNSSIPTEVG